jgi:hypothetical protein
MDTKMVAVSVRVSVFMFALVSVTSVCVVVYVCTHCVGSTSGAGRYTDVGVSADTTTGDAADSDDDNDDWLALLRTSPDWILCVFATGDRDNGGNPGALELGLVCVCICGSGGDGVDVFGKCVALAAVLVFVCVLVCVFAVDWFEAAFGSRLPLIHIVRACLGAIHGSTSCSTISLQ